MAARSADGLSFDRYGEPISNKKGKKSSGAVGYAVLCFANRDYDRLLPLLKDLTVRSVNLWRGDDPKSDPNVFRNTVAAIDNCSTFVLFLSHNALTSKRVMYYELDYALKTRPRDIYPVIIEDGVILPPEISSHFAGRLFLHRAGGTDKDLEEALFQHFCEKGCHPDFPVYDKNYRNYYEEAPDYEAPSSSSASKQELFQPVLDAPSKQTSSAAKPSVAKTTDTSKDSSSSNYKRELPVHPDFDFERNSNGATITRYKGKSSRVEVPAKMFGYGVTKLGDHVFENCQILEEVAIPPSVTEISHDAFKDCGSLSRVILPPSIEKICSGAFRNCTSLPTITLPSALTEIGDHSFEGCTSMNTITLPHRVTSVGDFAFNRCISLGLISLPDSLKSLSKTAFDSCSKKLSICASKDSVGAKFAAEHEIKFKKR